MMQPRVISVASLLIAFWAMAASAQLPNQPLPFEYGPTEVEEETDGDQVPAFVYVLFALLIPYGLVMVVWPGAVRRLNWAWYGAFGWKPDEESAWQSLAFYRVLGIAIIVGAVLLLLSLGRPQ